MDNFEVPSRVLDAYPDGVVAPLEDGGCAWCAEADSPMVALKGEGGLFRLEDAGANGLPVVWFCRDL